MKDLSSLSRRYRRKTRIVSLFLLFLLFFSSSGEGWLGWFEDEQVCGHIKDIKLENLTGQEVFLRSYIGNSPLLLVFWDTFCPYCLEAIRRLAYLSSSKEITTKIVLINISGRKERARRFLKHFKNAPFIILFDKQGRLTMDCKVIGIPTFVFLNKEGEIKFIGNFLPQEYLYQDQG